MKSAQNEIGKSAEKSLSVTTTTITTTAATAVEQQSAPLPTTAGTIATAIPIRFCTEIDENVHNNNNNATAANNAADASTTSSHAAKMTDDDEHNHENNNDNNSSKSINSNIINNNNSGNSYIAEAAKIFLKNGLNGASAAAAALLAAQLPTFPLVSIPKSSPETTVRGITDSLLEPPPAHVASTSKMSATATVSTAIALGHSPQRNNGLPSPSHFKATVKEAYSTAAAAATAASSSGINLARKSILKSEAGVIDCSLGSTANGSQKTMASLGIGSGGGYSQAGGGRLQFFKDGKFILELARSKDGERGGWVSVPRKQFRTPSATSSTVMPASTANTCIYPKIETSTSFSFSDDNSSIQSSPWQRDHCWKQATPKRNISKEMSVFYQLPNGVKLTNEGLRLAKLKRRRPFDNTKIDIKHIQLFENSNVHGENVNLYEMPNGKSTKFAASAIDEEEDRGSTSSVATLIGDNDDKDRIVKMESNDPTTPTNSIASPVDSSLNDSKDDSENTMATNEAAATKAAQQNVGKTDSDIKMEEFTCSTESVEKMNTSEDGGEVSTNIECKTSINMVKTENVTEPQLEQQRKLQQQQQRPLRSTPIKSKTGVEDKRLLKKRIERAKLITIVQKLIDQMPTRVANLMKTPSLLNHSAGTQQQSNSNFLSNKVSPTSSSSTSTSPSLISSSTSSACSAAVGTASHRLVEYHQQHVSPRKRILREFEKVSLDDAAATATGAGGKRSRAKSSANAGMSASYRNARSPNNRVHSSVCNVPTASSFSSSTSSTNGESVLKSNKNAASIPAPTRLYSSYSIHSLLGDNAGSKKTTDHSSNAFQQPHNDHLFHTRKSISPKSPEAGGGKSPSNSAHKKRSPPYASPLRETHSRSPTVISNSVDSSPRATPTTFKQRYEAPGLADHQHTSLTNAHHLQQQHHHQRQLQQQGAFYSPYMMSSSKYIPGASGIPLSAGAASPPSNPRHSNYAFTSCSTTPTTTTATATPTHYIPNAHRTMSQNRETSPPPRTMVDSPRDSTPRTLPKKTASIRRQFASPTSSSSSSNHSHNTTCNSSNNCPSPGERATTVSGEDSNLIDSKSTSAAAAAAATLAAYQQIFQRNSPSAAAAASPLHPAAYYMYPPAAPLPFTSNGPNGSAHAASTSPYIPQLMPPSSYYQSCISAFNITKHYYMGAGHSPQSAAAAAAARFPPPFHHIGIPPYNGLAMAAAASFTGQPTAHLAHHSMLSPSAAAAAALYGVGGSLAGHGIPSSSASSASASATNSTIATPQKSNESNSSAFNEASVGAITAAATSIRSTAANAQQHTHNITKDEQSSDVPLNLSKH